MAQACHGAYEAGKWLSDDRVTPDSMIVIGVKNQRELDKAQARLEAVGIKTQMFFEPDWEYGNTAFGTEPIGEELRVHLKRYQLWKV